MRHSYRRNLPLCTILIVPRALSQTVAQVSVPAVSGFAGTEAGATHFDFLLRFPFPSVAAERRCGELACSEESGRDNATTSFHDADMPYTYTIGERIVHVCWSGMIAKEDFDSLAKDMPRIGRELGFAPDVLHTFEETTGFSFEPIAAYQYSLRQKQAKIPNPVRAAMVVTTKEGEALAAVFKTLNRTPNLEMRVFADEADARLWLARK